MPRVLPDLSEGVPQGDPEAAGDGRAEVSDQPGTGGAYLLDGEHDPGLGVLVVIADGHGPGEVLDVLLARRELGPREGVVVDGASHPAI